MKKRLLQIVSAITVVLGVIGGSWAINDRFAKQCDLDLLSSRLEQKIVADQIYQMQRRQWMLEDRYGGPGVPVAPPVIKAEYRELLAAIERLKRKRK
jgi:hypothetical protein